MTTDGSTRVVLPSWQDASPSYHKMWNEIASENDLPPRLFMGSLVAGSFRETSEGWTADYEEGPFFVRLERKGVSIWITEGVHQDKVSMAFFNGAIPVPQILQHYIRRTGSFDDHLSALLAPYNITYYPYQSEGTFGNVCGFPDGTFTTLMQVLPFSSSTASRLESLVKEMIHAKLFSRGYVSFEPSTVNYREGRCPEVPFETTKHIFWLLENGFLPASVPVWQTGDSDRAFSSFRFSPVLRVTVPTRYVLKVVDICDKLGLVTRKDSPASDNMAFLLHHLDASLAQQVGNFVADGSRRVFIPLREASEDSNALMQDLIQEDSDSPPPTMEEFSAMLGAAIASFENKRDSMLATLRSQPGG